MENILQMIASTQESKKYRIVIDGNGEYRIQYKFNQMAMLTSQREEWHFDPRKFESFLEAEKCIGEVIVEKVLKEY
jgi:hypothetical protein